MTENLHDEPASEEQNGNDEREPAIEEVENQNADEIDKELLDAMKGLRRTNKKVEEYLDGLARAAEKTPPGQTDKPSDTPAE